MFVNSRSQRYLVLFLTEWLSASYICAVHEARTLSVELRRGSKAEADDSPAGEPAGTTASMPVKVLRDEPHLLVNVAHDPSKNQPHSALNSEQVRKALESIGSINDFPNDDITDEVDSVKSIQQKFRPIAELDADFKKIRLAYKSESEIIHGLLEQLFNVSANISNDAAAEMMLKSRAQLIILQDIEYYLHQYDNARDFVTMGGFRILAQFFNTSLQHTLNDVSRPMPEISYELLTEACRLISAACQSNPPVQAEALKMDFLSLLLRLFNAVGNRPVAVGDSVNAVLQFETSIWSALSATLRNYPPAQRALFHSGWPEEIRLVFDRSRIKNLSAESQSKSMAEINNPALLIKVVTTLADLWLERRDLLQQYHEAYSNIPIDDLLHQLHWCSFLLDVLEEEIDRRDNLPLLFAAVDAMQQTHEFFFELNGSAAESELVLQRLRLLMPKLGTEELADVAENLRWIIETLHGNQRRYETSDVHGEL